MPEVTVEPVTLAEAGQRYLASLRPAARQEQTPEINRFTRWCGQDRVLRRIRAAELERYTEENSTAIDAQRRLETVRAFLTWLKKAGLTPENMGVHIRYRRTGGPSTTSDPLNPDRVEVTAEGRAALARELETLHARRPKIAEALRTAMADKDFRENAPLDAAREQQAHLEARIRELESMLKRAVIVEGRGRAGVARMGSRVRLHDLASGREVTYILVGPGEVNASEGKISVSSPVGRALMDRAAGEEVEVAAPAKTFRYRIEAVEA